MCESGPRPGLCWRIRAVRQVNPLHYSTLKNATLLMSFKKPLRFSRVTKLSTLGVYTVHFHDQGLKNANKH